MWHTCHSSPSVRYISSLATQVANHIPSPATSPIRFPSCLPPSPLAVLTSLLPFTCLCVRLNLASVFSSSCNKYIKLISSRPNSVGEKVPPRRVKVKCSTGAVSSERNASGLGETAASVKQMKHAIVTKSETRRMFVMINGRCYGGVLNCRVKVAEEGRSEWMETRLLGYPFRCHSSRIRRKHGKNDFTRLLSYHRTYVMHIEKL